MKAEIATLLISLVAIQSTLATDHYEDKYQPQPQPQSRHTCTVDEALEHPHHCHLMHMAIHEPETLSSELYSFSKILGITIEAPVGHEHEYEHGHEHEHDWGLNGVDDSSTSVVRRHLRSAETKQDRNGIHTSTQTTDRKKIENTNNVKAPASALPTVLAHGMGDSCFNAGMQWITNHTSWLTNQYATCIPTGDNQHDDTFNGYFLSWDANIDAFASRVRADSNLSNGFSAIGFSQGNNVIRGYIAKYNDPPVDTFISINGVNAGIGAVPYCIPKADDASEYVLSNKFIAAVNADVDADTDADAPSPLQGKICNALMEIASGRAYSDFSQEHSFQANYWRDPRPEEKESFQAYSQLAKIGNEGLDQDPKLNENYAKTNKFVWVLATEDSLVWPPEGEWWGAPNPEDPFESILDMKETDWYTLDMFGLKTADLQRKNNFESFEGDHLRFEFDDYDVWIQTYLL